MAIRVGDDDRRTIREAAALIDTEQAKVSQWLARRAIRIAASLIEQIDREAKIVRLGDLDLAGWTPGRPKPSAINGPQIDAEVAGEATCEICGQEGLWFRPHVRDRDTGDGRGTYRAIAECPTCGHAFDF